MKSKFALTVLVAALFCSIQAKAETAGKVFDLASNSTVMVLADNGEGGVTSFGSGVVLDMGAVVTNCHVIADGRALTVRYQGNEYSAFRRYIDLGRDICMIEVPELNAPPVELGSTQGLRVGTRVYAIGAPKGLELTLSEGIVSGLRQVEGGQYIQTTAPVSPGSSGGGLFDQEGRLLGLVNFYVSGGQNLSFALPVEWIVEIPDPPAVSFAEWYGGASQLQKRGDWLEAVRHAQEWSKAMPDDPWPWFFLGVAHRKSDQMLEAINAFQQALMFKPKFSSFWFNLGLAYMLSDQMPQAIEAFQRTLSLNPSFANIFWYTPSTGYSLSEEPSKVIVAFKQVLRVEPEFFLAWYNLGLTYALSGESSRAIETLQKALRIDPQAVMAWYHLGVEYNKSGQSEKVLEVYRRLKDIDRDMADIFFNEIILPEPSTM